MENVEAPLALPENVLYPLCQPFRGEADCLLDLHEMTRRPSHPGHCVQCFFRLLGKADGEGKAALTPLRKWIEENITIAIEAGEREAGTLPVRLEATTDLDSFCYEAIRYVREDTVITDPQVELTFRYKGGVRAS